MGNGRMECAGQDRGSRYRTARNYLLQGNSAMDQQQYSEVMPHHLPPVSIHLLSHLLARSLTCLALSLADIS
jgi:hypothetical protein